MRTDTAPFPQPEPHILVVGPGETMLRHARAAKQGATASNSWHPRLLQFSGPRDALRHLYSLEGPGVMVPLCVVELARDAHPSAIAFMEAVRQFAAEAAFLFVTFAPSTLPADFMARCASSSPFSFVIPCDAPEWMARQAAVNVLCARQLLDHAHARHEALEDVVAQRNRDYESAQNQLHDAQRLEAIGQLAAGIAHELNTPTQFVSDNARFLESCSRDLEKVLSLVEARMQRGADPQPADESFVRELVLGASSAELSFIRAEMPRAIAQSLEGLERIASIVRAMKEFSHPGSSEKTPTDINKAIESTLTVCRNEWKYVARVETELDPQLPLVPCHAYQLNQAILNIVVNAAHAIAGSESASDMGTITVRTHVVAGCAVIDIHDTGPGVPEGIRHRIFEPFFTTKEVGKGTGQGLAIAYSAIVDKHAGSLTCQSPPGQGTTFTIGIPLAIRTEAAATA